MSSVQKMGGFISSTISLVLDVHGARDNKHSLEPRSLLLDERLCHPRAEVEVQQSDAAATLQNRGHAVVRNLSAPRHIQLTQLVAPLPEGAERFVGEFTAPIEEKALKVRTAPRHRRDGLIRELRTPAELKNAQVRARIWGGLSGLVFQYNHVHLQHK